MPSAPLRVHRSRSTRIEGVKHVLFARGSSPTDNGENDRECNPRAAVCLDALTALHGRTCHSDSGDQCVWHRAGRPRLVALVPGGADSLCHFWKALPHQEPMIAGKKSGIEGEHGPQRVERFLPVGSHTTR